MVSVVRDAKDCTVGAQRSPEPEGSFLRDRRRWEGAKAYHAVMKYGVLVRQNSEGMEETLANVCSFIDLGKLAIVKFGSC